MPNLVMLITHFGQKRKYWPSKCPSRQVVSHTWKLFSKHIESLQKTVVYKTIHDVCWGQRFNMDEARAICRFQASTVGCGRCLQNFSFAWITKFDFSTIGGALDVFSALNKEVKGLIFEGTCHCWYDSKGFKKRMFMTHGMAKVWLFCRKLTPCSDGLKNTV